MIQHPVSMCRGTEQARTQPSNPQDPVQQPRHIQLNGATGRRTESQLLAVAERVPNSAHDGHAVSDQSFLLQVDPILKIFGVI